MSDTTVSLLTPAGSGAIATVEVAGPRAWELARRHFRPAGSKPLPDSPPLHRFWYGTFGEGAGDEVVLAVKAADRVEVHCHGGRRVVRWVMEQFSEPLAALHEAPATACNAASGNPAALLPFAPTLRTASILLDQHHGAFDREVRRILSLLESNPAEAVEPLRRLASFASVGRHLVEPWKVVVAGPPNVGKSSLVNALAGYQRSVVSEVAGTTRDAVGVRLAFDGWPVELIDTAGLRESEGLEAEGVALAKRESATADLTLWVVDGSGPTFQFRGGEELDDLDSPEVSRGLLVANKIDLNTGERDPVRVERFEVSAKTRIGVGVLARAVISELIPAVPEPGNAVPYTTILAESVKLAHVARAFGEMDEAKQLLRACLEPR